MTYLKCDLTQTPLTTGDEQFTPVPAASSDRPRVLVADPDQLARRALTDSLRADGRFTVIGQASEGVELVELACHYRPDVVLVATGLAGLDAIHACEQIVASRPEVRVVVLATAPDLDLETRAVRAGAAGFVVKTEDIDSIKEAVTAAAAGQSIISADLTTMLIDRLRRTPQDGTGTRPVKSQLTNREWEILDLICGGMSTREIADSLFLSPETVNSHVKNVLKKLGVHSRAAAVEIAAALRADVLV
jgi:two-component system, NarL family, response regulator LiaR